MTFSIASTDAPWHSRLWCGVQTPRKVRCEEARRPPKSTASMTTPRMSRQAASAAAFAGLLGLPWAAQRMSRSRKSM
ncbi:hypothetical protein [Streptomyces sp. sk226]|uniref:hypothetical protein n=1 Tax=Streptomyces sp. sk226 TaxID=2034268 RepID=UPI00211D6750|nr:hypothetical protein [Streptomyces sp. sk226]